MTNNLKILKCEKVPSFVLTDKELKALRKKSFGERHTIMQNRARRCMEERKK